jgi:predicted DsbA family dithiol-disulfide isomerase
LRGVPVQVRYFTDPGCPWSWAAEPAVRRLMVEFGDSLSWSWLMVGLSREIPADTRGTALHWLGVVDRTGMPLDPLLWKEAPIRSTYPACMAAKAAAEQGEHAATRYLRGLREGLMCLRRKLDTTEALVEAAREAGLDVERFRVDLGSHAIVEAFGADLEAARDVPEQARAADAVADVEGGPRVSIPAACFGDGHWWFDTGYEDLRAAALAAGATATASGEGGVSVLDALGSFGRMATLEVQEVCRLPGPRAHAELWRLAMEWQVKPIPVLTGHLWELV